jgi:excisionase family DNA binding protein
MRESRASYKEGEYGPMNVHENGGAPAATEALAQLVETSPSTSTLSAEPDVGQPEVRSAYLVVEEVADRLRCSERTVRELARENAIPLRKLPRGRRLLFIPAELEAWEAGAELEVKFGPRGSRVVRPVPD